MTQLLWFRQDLRVFDNPALEAAAQRGKILPVYILDETAPPAGRPLGGASRWWLHHSLLSLSRSLGSLVLLRGDPIRLLPELAHHSKASGVFWNRCYDPQSVARDRALKTSLRAEGLMVETFNSALLFEPWEIRTGTNQPYRVFSPFWRVCRSRDVPVPSSPAVFSTVTDLSVGDTLESWNLLPSNPDWAREFHTLWSPGEAGARRALEAFLRDGFKGYRALRDYPSKGHVSRLSPYIHFGEISPRQIWADVRARIAADPGLLGDADKLLWELGWREFAHHLLFHFPTLATANWKATFDGFPWRNDAAQLRAWQRGRTGYPLVDAGMRELWATGYLPNRVRLVAASFLTKHLRIDWRRGEEWFWDTLVDADAANNAAGWQWVFGSGTDAAPFFRIFNPTEQARKFDPEGRYIRRWCPELALLPDEWIHAPFEAPAEVLARAGVALGRDYPLPIVDHKQARREALEGYAVISSTGQVHST